MLQRSKLVARVVARFQEKAFKFEPKESKERKAERISKIIRDATGLSKGIAEAIADAIVRRREIARLAIQKGWPIVQDTIEGPGGSIPLDAVTAT